MQSQKAKLSIFVTEEGIEISFKDEHFLNKDSQILSTGELKMTLISDEHSSKADEPISVTEEGIDNFVNEKHLLKHEKPIV